MKLGKKIISVLTVAAMMTALAACGNGDGSSNGGSSVSNTGSSASSGGDNKVCQTKNMFQTVSIAM